ncbi:MAG: hypothetical protein ACXWHI_05325 [Candidatus Aminicenantales bacterium]
MNKKRLVIWAIVSLVLAASGPALFGQAGRTGQQIPPMPRIWDEGLGSWASLGFGPSGLVAAFTRQLEHTVGTLRAGFYWGSEAFSGGDMAMTVGLPLSRGRVFASVGGGLGCMIGRLSLDPKTKAYLALAADLQVSLRLSSRVALGLYAPLSVSTHKAVGGICLCLQYGRWQI